MLLNRLRVFSAKFSSSKSGPAPANFFEINPIHPTFREPGAKLYGPPSRNYITPLEQQLKLDKARVKQLVWFDRVLGSGRNGRKRFTQDNKRAADRVLNDASGQLPLEYGFEWYTKNAAGRRTTKANSDYMEAITNIISKFQVKSEPELVRFFRLALADLQSNDIKEKLRGAVLRRIVLEAAAKNDPTKAKQRLSAEDTNILQGMDMADFLESGKKTKKRRKGLGPHISEEALEKGSFLVALRRIDQKIAEAERQLDVHGRYSLRDEKFNSHYQEPDAPEETIVPLDADINFDRRDLFLKTSLGSRVSSSQKEFQDNVIEQKIRRLFFLNKAKLQVQRKSEEENKRATQELAEIVSTADLLGNQKLIASLASEYALQDEIPPNDLQNTYKEVDLLLQSLKIKGLKSGAISPELQSELQGLVNGQTTYKHSHDLLWQNIKVEEVYNPTDFLEVNASIAESDKFVKNTDGNFTAPLDISPNADMEVSLNSVPFNLYRHSEYRVFGIANTKRGSEQKVANGFTPIIDSNEKDFPKFDFEALKPKKQAPLPPKPVLSRDFYGGGRRKTAHALCRLHEGTGVARVNRKNIADYFDDTVDRGTCLKPLLVCGETEGWDVDFFVYGSGFASQADACGLALARALSRKDPNYKRMLRKNGLVSQDQRFKERKHSGKYKARKAYPYVRR